MNFKEFLAHSDLKYKDYQEEGVKWCIERERSPEYSPGGIIADEMGLGKTIMMIGNLVCNFQMSNLIIVPVFLMEQWKEQIYRATNHKALIYHGPITKILTVKQLQQIPIIITTYGSVVSDNKKEKRILQEIMWNRVICDEAHHMRNRKTKVKQAVFNLNRKITWLISGTPIQNHINDLYSLFDILQIPNKVYTNTANLRDIINKVVLKRTKREVGIMLPKLHLNRIETKWENPKEQALSEDIHDKLSFSLLKQKPIEKEMVLAMMIYARMICVYPKLAAKHIQKIKEMGYIEEENVTGVNYNSKMNTVIRTIVDRKDNGNRKIIFATFKGEIDYLQEQLKRNDLNVKYIDGRISGKRKRKELLNDMSIDVLLLQIKTGNEGLNLQHYNEAYFVTPDWNPKVEEQAIARCHRLGQNKEVYVFRFVMNGFDEEHKTKNIEMYSEGIQNEKKEIEETHFNN
tara:strand:+ start:114 stop:1490 length:1377 start_codon:yes stop_codon:yes gene_type:complete